MDAALHVDKGTKAKYYAVQVGKQPGVYTDWETAKAQVVGVRGPRHRKFLDRADAEAFVAEGRKGAAAVAVTMAQHADKRIKLANGAAAPGGLQLESPYFSTPAGPEEHGNDPQSSNDSNILIDSNGNQYPPGTAPFSLDTEDGFDPNIKLSSNGELVYKSEQEKAKTKMIPKPAPVPETITIYTDGSSLQNGAAGARAGVGVYFGPGDGKNVSESLPGNRQTNQRAELTAILRALELAPGNRHVTICTDSRYAIDCVTNWYRNWKRNGWLSTNRKPVENRDLVQEIRAKMEERTDLRVATCFTWVKGHAGHAGNVEADRLAIQGATSGRTGTAKTVAAGAMAPLSAETTAVPNEDDRGQRHDNATIQLHEDEEEDAFKAMERAMQEAEEEEKEEKEKDRLAQAASQTIGDGSTSASKI